MAKLLFLSSQGPPGPAGVPGFAKDGAPICACTKGEKGDQGKPVCRFLHNF